MKTTSNFKSWGLALLALSTHANARLITKYMWWRSLTPPICLPLKRMTPALRPRYSLKSIVNMCASTLTASSAVKTSSLLWNTVKMEIWVSIWSVRWGDHSMRVKSGSSLLRCVWGWTTSTPTKYCIGISRPSTCFWAKMTRSKLVILV